MKFRLYDIDVHSALVMDDAVLEWIHVLKFSRLLSRFETDRLRVLANREMRSFVLPFDVVAAVPSHPLRSLLQVDLAHEWASCVALSSDRRFDRNLLAHASLPRALLRSPQKSLSAFERRIRFANPARRPRFRSPPAEKSLRIFLVDDVLTTASSFLEAREALERVGHRVVGGAVLASPAPPTEVPGSL